MGSLAKKGACCAGVDIHDARRVASDMGFPHYVLDYENIFRDAVIDEFADSYLSGATPVPCIRCNERVKFKDLLETAKDLDADCMATGHYIQRKMGPTGAELHSAADANRDQSYFLFSTTQEQLDYLRFPLVHLPSNVARRALAAEHGLIVADKPDSQDICFVPDGNYAGVLKNCVRVLWNRVILLIQMARFWANTTVLFTTPSVNAAVWASGVWPIRCMLWNWMLTKNTSSLARKSY